MPADHPLLNDEQQSCWQINLDLSCPLLSEFENWTEYMVYNKPLTTKWHTEMEPMPFSINLACGICFRWKCYWTEPSEYCKSNKTYFSTAWEAIYAYLFQKHNANAHALARVIKLAPNMQNYFLVWKWWINHTSCLYWRLYARLHNTLINKRLF